MKKIFLLIMINLLFYYKVYYIFWIMLKENTMRKDKTSNSKTAKKFER